MVQVVGAAVVDGRRVLVAQRSGGPYDGLWEFPGGKVEPGESDLSALVREMPGGARRRRPAAGVPRRGAAGRLVAGGAPGTSTLRVWWARLADGAPGAHEHAALRWAEPTSSTDLDWIAADRPLLPAVRTLLARL